MSVGVVVNHCYCEYVLPRDILQKYLTQYLFVNGSHFMVRDSSDNYVIATPYNFNHNIISRNDPIFLTIVEEYIKEKVKTGSYKISSAMMFDIILIPDCMINYYEIRNNNGKEYVALLEKKYKDDIFKKLMERQDVDNKTKIKLATELYSQIIPRPESLIEILENIKQVQQIQSI